MLVHLYKIDEFMSTSFLFICIFIQLAIIRTDSLLLLTLFIMSFSISNVAKQDNSLNCKTILNCLI